jgi:hypothetical protein
MSATEIVQAVSGHAWPAAVLLTVLLVLRIPVVRAAGWNVFLKLIGVSKAERRRVGVAAARRDLNLRDPPAT